MTSLPAAADVGSPLAEPPGDAPSSSTVVISRAPQPLDPAVPTPATLVTEKLDTILSEAIRWLDGKELAVFEWRTVTGKDGRVAVRGRGADGNTFVLDWAHAAATRDVGVRVEAYCKRHDEVYLRLRIGGKYRDWCLASGTDVKRWCAGEAVSSTLPNPRGASGLEFLGHVWFSDGTAHDSGVTRHGRPAWRLEAVKGSWPKFGLEKSRRWTVQELPPLDDSAVAEKWGGAIGAFAIWSVLTWLFQEAHEDVPTADAFGLPAQKEYFPQRAVNLNGSEVISELEREAYRLRLPWHVIEAACASLNSGKHVLFTGPPGCGKSKLAIALAQIATGRRPLVVTASPAWTSGDLIGRYLPRRDGHGLSFVPGAFLRAAEQERWLVVDEFNRANIDECFGELFSVLANDTVELPFEDQIEDDAVGNPRFAPVRIVPAVRAGEESGDQANAYCDYQVSPAFRLVGTMNDADRATLHQLSFALQRRFDVIRVEAPPWEVVRQIIEEEMARLEKGQSNFYQFTQRANLKMMGRPVDLDDLRDHYFHRLFACDPAKKDPGDVLDLVSERIIGLATVRDVMRFVGEGLRGPVGAGDHAVVLLPEGMTTHGVAASYVAMGLVLSVFPQLEAVDPERQIQVIRFIVDSFRDAAGTSLPLLRLTTLEGRDEQFTVERVRASEGNAIDRDNDGRISIPEYMVGELLRQFKGSGMESDLMGLIRREPQPADDG